MFGSLRARYYLVVVGIATIPVLLLGLYAGLRSAAELERQSLVLQNELALRVEREIASFISTRINELRVLERTNLLVGMSSEDISAIFGRLLAHNQVYQDVIMLTEVGEVSIFRSRSNTNPRDAEHWNAAPYLELGFWDSESKYVGPVEFDAQLREPLLDIGIPVFRRQSGEVANVLLAHVRFKPIWDLLADLGLPGETEAFVVNQNGRVLAHRSPGEVLSASVYEFPAENGRHPLADGRPGLVAIQPLSLVGETAYVVVTRPLDVALASAIDTRTATLISAVLLLIGGSILALQQSNAIVRPVEALAGAARRISSGDLDTKIDVTGPYEIETLSQTLQDMTGQISRTVGSLKRSEFAERQKALVTLESIGDAVITTDPVENITYINPVAEELTGWTLKDAVGRHITDVFCIVNESTRAPAPNPVARCLSSGRIVGLANHTALLSRDGQEYSIRDSAAPIREADGEVIGVVMVFRDITEEKAIEDKLRERQKMEAIGQLSGGIAHDFNNLMQVIQGNAELLVEEPNVDPLLAKPILRATERGAELTKRLLSFARKQPMRPKSIDVTELLNDLQLVLVRTLGETINVSLRTAPDIWSAQADPGQLENALLNLALNARDAMPNGGKLVIRCENAARDTLKEVDNEQLTAAEFVAISVSDDGEGMSPETLNSAIEPFFTTKRVGEGSGLGLSMVYGFAMQSGGHFQIESTQSAGTTVTIFLPRSLDMTVEAPVGEREHVQSGNGETVLIVEDDPEVMELVKRILKRLGYRVAEAKTVRDAKALLDARQHVDLVLTDVVLPGGESGIHLARDLRERRPDLPVALMSGYPDVSLGSQEAEGYELVALKKPFHKDEIAKTIKGLLDRRQPSSPTIQNIK